MAVLAHAAALRRMLQRSRDAQEQAEQAKEAQQDAEGAATAVGEALQWAADGDDEDGTVPTRRHRRIRRAPTTAEATARQTARALTAAARYEAGPGGVTRQVWAELCALALLDQARHAGRDVFGIRRRDPDLPLPGLSVRLGGAFWQPVPDVFRQGERPRPHEA
ncbi:hypothetical protein [Streptomyces sp. NPDC002845]